MAAIFMELFLVLIENLSTMDKGVNKVCEYVQLQYTEWLLWNMLRLGYSKHAILLYFLHPL